jgi:hypothetical protein
MTNPQSNDYIRIRKSLGGTGLALLWIGVLSVPLVEATTCNNGSEDNWFVSLLLYLPVSTLFLALAFIGSSKPNYIRWLTLPLWGLIPWAGFIAAKYTYGVSFLNNHLCSVATGNPNFNSYPSSWWDVLWGPVQLVFVASVAWCVYKYWVSSITANKALNSQVSPAGTPQSGAH